MTTDRTAIRRWLAIGSTAHRPPSRPRKTRHRIIVAPLAAALGATAAVGVALALARAGGGQLSGRRRRNGHEPGVLPGEPVAEALRRMVLAQADLALAELGRIAGEGAQGGDDAQAVHEARKAIKRMRTAVRLLREELGSAAYAREDEALKRAGHGLSVSRDAEVLLATLEGLIERHPRRLGRSRGIARMRRRLAQERESARRQMREDPRGLAAVTVELSGFRSRAADWALSPRPGVAVAAPGLRAIYRQGRQRGRHAAKASARRRTRAMHRWRKRVKDLRYAAEMLEHARPQSGRLAKIARRADKLGETLGEDHDLAVLCEWVGEQGKRTGASRAVRKRLLKAIAKRRRKLRRRAFEDGKQLYRRRTRKFLARARRSYARAEQRA